MITPINQHIQIRPISRVADEGIMATANKNYDAKGIVISAPEFAEFKGGQTVYFDAWRAKKFNEDTEEEFWLIEYSAVAAYE